MIEMKQVLKVLIGIGFLTVACCVLYAENESNDDARVNANLGGILSLPLHPTEHFATIGGGEVGGAGYNFTPSTLFWVSSCSTGPLAPMRL